MVKAHEITWKRFFMCSLLFFLVFWVFFFFSMNEYCIYWMVLLDDLRWCGLLIFKQYFFENMYRTIHERSTCRACNLVVVTHLTEDTEQSQHPRNCFMPLSLTPQRQPVCWFFNNKLYLNFLQSWTYVFSSFVTHIVFEKFYSLFSELAIYWFSLVYIVTE